MSPLFRFHSCSFLILLTFSLQVPLSAEDFTLKDKATGTIQVTFSSITGMLKLGEARYSIISEKGDADFMLVGDEKGVLKTYGPFAWKNGTECVIGGVTYVLAKSPEVKSTEGGTPSASTQEGKKQSQDPLPASGSGGAKQPSGPPVQFALQQEASGQFYGFFLLQDNSDILLPEGKGRILTTDRRSFSIALYPGGIKTVVGPFSFTNNSKVITRQSSYLVKTNIAEINASVTKQVEEIRRYDQEQMDKGLVKFEGAWIAPGDRHERVKQAFSRMVANILYAESELESEMEIVKRAQRDAIALKGVDDLGAYQAYRRAENHLPRLTELNDRVKTLEGKAKQARLGNPAIYDPVIKELSSDSDQTKVFRDCCLYILQQSQQQ